MNKRVIAVLICLLLVIIPTILLSAVFIVRDVDVVGMGKKFDYDAKKLARDSGIPMLSSIFVLSEDNVAHNIERKNPGVKVVNIERIFPNKVVVNVMRRVPLFAVKVKGTHKYALVDRELRVVDIVDSYAKESVMDYTIYSLDMGSDVSLKNKIVTLKKNEIGAMIIKDIIRVFEGKKLAEEKMVQYISSVTFDNKNVYIKTRGGCTLEVFIKPSKGSFKEMLSIVLEKYLLDRNSDDSVVDTHGVKVNTYHTNPSGVYYFNIANSKWEYTVR